MFEIQKKLFFCFPISFQCLYDFIWLEIIYLYLSYHVFVPGVFSGQNIFREPLSQPYHDLGGPRFHGLDGLGGR